MCIRECELPAQKPRPTFKRRLYFGEEPSSHPLEVGLCLRRHLAPVVLVPIEPWLKAYIAPFSPPLHRGPGAGRNESGLGKSLLKKTRNHGRLRHRSTILEDQNRDLPGWIRSQEFRRRIRELLFAQNEWNFFFVEHHPYADRVRTAPKTMEEQQDRLRVGLRPLLNDFARALCDRCHLRHGCHLKRIGQTDSGHELTRK